MGREGTRPRLGVVGVTLVCVVALVATQSMLHLELVLGRHRLDTVFDLDRSNGIPDVVSTLALAAACAAAGALAWRGGRHGRAVPASLAAALGILALADALHDGAHSAGQVGRAVIGLSLAAAGLLALVAPRASWASRAVLVVALLALAGSFAVPGLDRYDQWFERERGDPVREYQIVAKEGLELLGWSLVAIALANEALRRRDESSLASTGRASREPAARTRRAA